MPALLLGHQGGWDEMLLVAVPIALFGGLLWLANRRAEAHLRQEADAAGELEPDQSREQAPANDTSDPSVR